MFYGHFRFELGILKILHYMREDLSHQNVLAGGTEQMNGIISARQKSAPWRSSMHP